MKIAIYTLPFEKNYGGVLQAYALQEYLISEGHEVVILQRRRDSGLIKNILKRIKWAFYKVCAKININRNNVFVKFENFKLKHLHQSRLMFSSQEIAKWCKDEGINVVVVGSDQVWRLNSAQDINDAFLAFVPVKVKRIAYAASFGVDYWEFSNEMTARINALIREFELISVREQAGIDLCKKHLDINATLVLDPTLLAGRKLFQKIVDSEKKDLHAGVFCYFLDPNNKKRFLANSASKSLGCECFGNLTDLRKDSIEEWVSSFIRADFVITDSFHGTCFAILFEKQFIALSNSSRGNARFQSLLKLVGLENRFVSDNVDPKEMLNRMKLLIDYKTVNKKLSFERAKARGKLMEAILK